jgi:serine/threonine protein kinase
MPQSSHDSAEHATPSAERIAAVRGAEAKGYALVAVLGYTSGRAAAYLAREEATGDLVAITVDPSADAPGRFSFSVHRELNFNIPGPLGACPSCGRGVDGWIRTCTCGVELSGVSYGSESERLALLEHVHQATAGEYEILGAIRYAGDGGAAYFGQQPDANVIVALRLYDDGEFSDGTTRYRLAATEPLARLDETSRSPRSGPVHFTPAHAFKVVSDETPASPDPLAPNRSDEHHLLRRSGLGSGLLAKVPTPRPDEQIVIPKICPSCGTEYETGSRFCPSDGSPLKPKGSTDPLVGRVLADRYHILKKLGEGGMGRVYLCEHVKMNRQCAIKVMSAQLVNDSESAMRFSREASNAARIIHPNVAAVFDYGESDGLVYIVMEYVDGESLSTLLEQDSSLPPHRALDIARQVADGLAAAHELGIVHRDLKPDNIIVGTSRSGREVAKVVDFGIAKAVQEGPQEALTRTGLVIGTPEYMSPEQLLGDPVDERADVYSLGCILYQMLTGTPTFHAATREQMITRRLTEDPPHLRVVVPELPESLDQTVYQMLARTPGNRIATAAEVRERLAPSAALGEQWDPTFKPTPRSAPTIQMNAVGTTEKFAVSAGRTRNVRRVRSAIAAGTAVLVMGVGYAWSRGTGGAANKDSANVGAAVTPPVDSTKPIAANAGNSGARSADSSALRQPGTALPAGATTRIAPKPAGPKIPVRTVDRNDRTAESALIRKLRQPLQEFGNDYANADSVKLSTYPGIEESQITQILATIPQLKNARAEIIDIRPTGFGGIDSSTVQVDFKLVVHGIQKDNSPMSSSRLPYHATLRRRAGTWLLDEVKVDK